MTPHPAALWARLAAAGLVEGEPPAPEAGRRWYVRLMLGAAAWLAASTLMGFIVGLSFVLLKSRAGVLGTGIVACVLAYGLFLRGRTSHWHAQLGLAASFVGQGLMAWGLFGSFENGPDGLPLASALLCMALIETLLTVALPNAINRFVSAQLALGLLALAADTEGLGTLVLGGALMLAAMIWLNEFRWHARAEALRAIGFGIASSLPGLALVVRHRLAFPPPGEPGLGVSGLDFRAPWLASVLAGAVLLATVLVLCRRQGVAPGGRTMGFAGLAAVLCGLLDLKAAGIASSLLLVVLGFAHGNRLLLGLGLVSLGACVSWFYYSLSLTLLEKSGWLAVAGIVLLLARAALPALLGPSPPAPPEADAHA